MICLLIRIFFLVVDTKKIFICLSNDHLIYSPFSHEMEKIQHVVRLLKKDLRRRPFINERIIFHDHAICLFVYVFHPFVRMCAFVAACRNSETVNK